MPEIVEDPEKWWIDNTEMVSEYDKSAVDMSGEGCIACDAAASEPARRGGHYLSLMEALTVQICRLQV